MSSKIIKIGVHRSGAYTASRQKQNHLRLEKQSANSFFYAHKTLCFYISLELKHNH